MSNFYIRILVNNTKVRSTGKEKWQRDEVLKDFGCYAPFFENIDDEQMKRIQNTLVQHALLKDQINPFTDTPRFDYSEIFHFRIQLMRKSKTKKDIVGEFYVPFSLKAQNFITDGERKRILYILQKRPYDFYNMGDTLNFKRYKLKNNVMSCSINELEEEIENRSCCVLELFDKGVE